METHRAFKYISILLFYGALLQQKIVCIAKNVNNGSVSYTIDSFSRILEVSDIISKRYKRLLCFILDKELAMLFSLDIRVFCMYRSLTKYIKCFMHND